MSISQQVRALVEIILQAGFLLFSVARGDQRKDQIKKRRYGLSQSLFVSQIRFRCLNWSVKRVTSTTSCFTSHFWFESTGFNPVAFHARFTGPFASEEQHISANPGYPIVLQCVAHAIHVQEAILSAAVRDLCLVTCGNNWWFGHC